MNRAQRRAQAKTARAKRALPKAPQALDIPSDEVVDGICRAHGKRSQLFLPARICGRCIETAIQIASGMTQDQAAAMLAAIEAEEAADVS